MAFETRTWNGTELKVYYHHRPVDNKYSARVEIEVESFTFKGSFAVGETKERAIEMAIHKLENEIKNIANGRNIKPAQDCLNSRIKEAELARWLDNLK